MSDPKFAPMPTFIPDVNANNPTTLGGKVWTAARSTVAGHGPGQTGAIPRTAEASPWPWYGTCADCPQDPTARGMYDRQRPWECKNRDRSDHRLGDGPRSSDTPIDPCSLREELTFIVSYLAHNDQDANHAWMVRRIRAVLAGKDPSTVEPWNEHDGVRKPRVDNPLPRLLFSVMAWDRGNPECSDCTKRKVSKTEWEHESECGHLRDLNAAYKALGREDCIDAGYTAPEQRTETPLPKGDGS